MKIPFFSQRQNRAARSIPAEKRSSDPVDIILQYHEQTKHHYYRLARSLGFLDWENQPNPFRRFEGAPLFELPLLPKDEVVSFDDLFSGTQITQVEFSIESISRFLRNALAISAWKRAEDERWSLRVNPSSGNLHPTEGYIILPSQFSDLPAGVYHYAPKEHALEQRAKFQSVNFPAETFFVGLTSIFWREAWKYGERAYRYCQHDAGHAIAALRISAALLGWKLILQDELSDEDTARMLGLNRSSDFEQAEDEDPVCIAAVFKEVQPQLRKEFIDSIEGSEWHGHANLLSETHVEWEIIDQVARSSYKPMTVGSGLRPTRDTDSRETSRSETSPYLSAEQIIQQRRSCLALDAVTSISREGFYSILSSVASNDAMPFDSFQNSEMRKPRIHLALFVLRVNDFEPGIYFLLRDAQSLTELQQAMNSNFKWQRAEGCPDEMNLFLLRPGDFHEIAAGVVCGQDVGGDGVFSLGMIAELEDPVRSVGPWMYKRLFWEAGAIGQVLYLQAEAAGLRSTGIGCYYDDPMHELLGLEGHRFQDLYHFTMGGNVDDARLTTEPAYPQT